MKVRCVDNANGILKLTIGKEYEVTGKLSEGYEVVNDMGVSMPYNKIRFEVVKEGQQEVIQCGECACKPICKEVENWTHYCKEHIELRKKSVLFDVDPSCRYFIDKKTLENCNEDKDKESKNNTIEDFELHKPFSDDKTVEEGPEYDFSDKESNHIVEDTNTRIKELDEEDFKWLLEQLLGIK